LPDPGALVFDLDGTLVDTVATRIDAWLRVFAEESIEADTEQVALLIGADGKRLARTIAHESGRELSEGDAERIDARSGAIYDELNSHPRPIDGARSLLVALEHSALPWAIATSSRAEQVGVSVAALELPEPPLIVDGSHVEHAKPAPDLLLLVAERLEMAPGQCWYVGDATWDMRAAKAAGMVAIGVPYGAADEAALSEAGADAVSALDDLEAELRRRALV
jgi:HAD superfamily hydrolase (TIGR01509 family)